MSPRASRRKNLRKRTAEINKIENKKKNRENQCNQKLAPWKYKKKKKKYKIDRPLVRLTKKKSAQITKSGMQVGTLLLTLQQ